MSGGSMDYLYSRVRYADFRRDTPLRRVFAEHLDQVADALHDIEWVDSSDYGPGDEDAAIRRCLGIADAVLDARRYRAFFDAGLPITFEGEEYRTKAELDAAIDASLAERQEQTP